MPAERRQDLAKDTLPAAPALQPLCIQPYLPCPWAAAASQRCTSKSPQRQHVGSTKPVPQALPSAMRLSGEVVGLVFVHLCGAKPLNSEYNF